MENETDFVKYRLTWRFTDDGDLQESFFWLPNGADPKEHVNDILNIVELSASEYGYEYDLSKIVRCSNCTDDIDTSDLEGVTRNQGLDGSTLSYFCVFCTEAEYFPKCCKCGSGKIHVTESNPNPRHMSGLKRHYCERCWASEHERRLDPFSLNYS